MALAYRRKAAQSKGGRRSLVSSTHRAERQSDFYIHMKPFETDLGSVRLDAVLKVKGGNTFRLDFFSLV